MKTKLTNDQGVDLFLLRNNVRTFGPGRLVRKDGSAWTLCPSAQVLAVALDVPAVANTETEAIALLRRVVAAGEAALNLS